MVNRKSRNADFIQNGSPKKKIAKGVLYAPKKKKVVKKKAAKKRKGKKRKKNIFVAW